MCLLGGSAQWPGPIARSDRMKVGEMRAGVMLCVAVEEGLEKDDRDGHGGMGSYLCLLEQ